MTPLNGSYKLEQPLVEITEILISNMTGIHVFWVVLYTVVVLL